MSTPHADDLISLPSGGGGVAAIGETFTPDPHTGTGALRIPLELPPGRNGMAPTLALSYGSGLGNGPFGQGWRLDVPAISRKTALRVPRYDGTDTFVISGAEDLVAVPGGPTGIQRYRPRAETLFARIEHHTANGDHWQVCTTDGHRTWYGTPRPADAPPGWRDPAVIADPADPTRILTWLPTRTEDSLGNVVAYAYDGDPADPAAPQRYLTRLGYVDYPDPAGGDPLFLVQVLLHYQPRPDRLCERRGGFAVSTTLRCASIETWTGPDGGQRCRSVNLDYRNATGNGVSLLSSVRVTGHDGTDTQSLPPVEFGYTDWAPEHRRYRPVAADGAAPPPSCLARPDTDLVDLCGHGLPDLLQLTATGPRYWRNRGDGRLDAARPVRAVPAGVALGAPGVRLADMDGDGRTDLVVTDGPRAGYLPVAPDGFDPAGYVTLPHTPSFGLDDPQTRLIDLDGDGVVDALRAGPVPQMYLNRGRDGWQAGALGAVRLPPGLALSDSRLKLADMTGDGLTDLVLVGRGQIRYWPNLGYGRFGDPVVMAGSPRLDDGGGYGPAGPDDRRLLLADVDGDGCADLVYVGSGSVTVWINQGGAGYGPPVRVAGTPAVDDTLTNVRAADLLGTGTAGVLWSLPGNGRTASLGFLDLTGGTKPYLLSTVDNHMGGVTTVRYRPSTRYAADDAAAGRPWRTTLPFPVQVVAEVTHTDAVSGCTRTLGYAYHHGYWDGAEREFRGFGHVEVTDGSTIDEATGTTPHAPPTRTHTWYHLGPVGPALGGWSELDLSDEYWPGDPPLLGPGDRSAIPVQLPRRGRRDAIRALAGSVLRSEVYGLDAAAAATRPYTVTENRYDLLPVLDAGAGPEWLARPVVSARCSGVRVTAWERGDDPMTRITLHRGFDGYGRCTDTAEIAVPRGQDPHAAPAAAGGQAPLVTRSTVSFATRDDAEHYLCDRAAATRLREVLLAGWPGPAALDAAVFDEAAPARLLGLTRTRYDGEAFVGLPDGQLGEHGLPTATASLATTRGILGCSHDPAAPPPYMCGPDTTPVTGLNGAYYRDTALSTLAFSRPDPVIDFTWSGGPDPGLTQPTFSTRWTGNLTPRFTETHTLTVDARGGVRLWIDGQLLIDTWTAPAATAHGTLPVQAGTAYPVRLEYRADGWAAGVRLSWSSPSQPAQVVPATCLTPGAGGTPGWPDRYPAGFRAGVDAGYVYRPGGDGLFEPGYYILTGSRYDVQDGPDGRGLPTVQRDPMGHDTTIGYDSWRLLPVAVTDTGGMTRTARYDQRTLRPVEVVDANGNHTVAGYTPLGLLAYTADLGHSGAREADTPEQPGTRYSYGLTAWDDSAGGVRQPTWVHTVRRVEHRWTLVEDANAARVAAGQPALTDDEIDAMFPADEPTAFPHRFIQTRTYADGTGRAVQTRSLADPLVIDDLGLDPDMAVPAGDLIAHDTSGAADPAVLVTGWRVYDDRGRVVRAFEPYFDAGWWYAPPGPATLAALAHTDTDFDTRGEVVRVTHPDGSQDRYVQGVPSDLGDPDTYRPTPWQRYAYDRDDNAGRTHPDTSGSWSAQWNTPTDTLADPLGHLVRHTARLAGGEVVTTSTHDVRGNLLSVTDPLGRTAASTVYDLAGRVWSRTTADAGTTRTVIDAAGGIVELGDAKGALHLTAFDALHRPVRGWTADSATAPVTLRQVLSYGDAPDDGLTPEAAAAANLRGRAYRCHDESGRLVHRGYDLHGAPTGYTRHVLSTATLLSRLPGTGGDWSTAGYTVDWQPPVGGSTDEMAAALLDPTGYDTDLRHDALGRRTSRTGPVDATGDRPVLSTTYTRAGAVASMTLDGTVYLSRVCYDAHGRRVAALHGNGMLTRYAYDPASLRLARQHSVTVATGDTTVWHPTGPVRHDQGLRYDLVGNPILAAERTPGAGLPGATPDALDRVFGYDSLYRLVSATGREHAQPPPQLWSAAPRGGDPTATQPYTETYGYDPAGNLLSLTHRTPTAGTTRTIALVAGGNTTATMTVGGTRCDYDHDPCGNLTRETTSRHFGWDAEDRLVTFRVQPDGAATPSTFSQYRYDAGGQRVIKLVRDQGGGLELTLYLDGLHRLVLLDTTGVATVSDEILVEDTANLVAVVRRGATLPGDRRPPVAYHLADQLGSSIAVLDGDGAPVTIEEYSPYGETTFGGYARKRYRYTGRERDEDSGLAYHGARYYAPWLCRWTSPDPQGLADGPSPYVYVRGGPLRRTDPSGTVGLEMAPTTSMVPPASTGAPVTGAGSATGAGSWSWTTPEAAGSTSSTGAAGTAAEVTSSTAAAAEGTSVTAAAGGEAAGAALLVAAVVLEVGLIWLITSAADAKQRELTRRFGAPAPQAPPRDAPGAPGAAKVAPAPGRRPPLVMPPVHVTGRVDAPGASGGTAHAPGAADHAPARHAAKRHGVLDPSIAVDMRKAPNASAVKKGPVRNGPWFWRQLLERHPEWFSADNEKAIRDGLAPLVDAEWLRHHQHDIYEGDKLVHHHNEQTHWAVPIPEELHRLFHDELHLNPGPRGDTITVAPLR